MSVYLALHTSASPSLADVAEFGRIALALGGDPDSGLAVERADNGQLTVVLPIPDTSVSPPVTADHTPERLSADPPDAGMPIEHVIDRDGYVWRVVRDGGMATRAHYAGLISIGISALERQSGPLLDLAAHLADVEARLAAVEALPAKWREDHERDYVGAYECADELAAVLLPEVEVTRVEPGCTCDGIAACLQCQERDADRAALHPDPTTTHRRKGP